MAASVLNVRQMEVIRAVLQAGTMTKAADHLGISQPAISRMIRHAEQRSGLMLFHRKGASLIPTPEALQLQTEIERIFLDVDRAQRLALALRQGWGRILRIACVPSLSSIFVAPAASTLSRHQPEAKLILKTLDSAPIEAGVRNGDFDFGLVQGVRQPQDFAVLTLVETTMVCMLPQNHRLAAQKAIMPTDLLGERLISFGRLNPLGIQADRLYDSLGLARQVAIQTGNAPLAMELVRSGCGVALSDPFATGCAGGNGIVVRPLSPRVAVRAHIIFRRDRSLSALEQQIVAAVKAAGEDWRRATLAVLAPVETPVEFSTLC
jgi:DNA-binding transcriptional LysR family regulator